MDLKNMREMLKRWAACQSFCESKMREMKEFRALLEDAASMRPPVNDGMSRGSQTGDPTQQTALRVIQLREKYDWMVRELQEDVEREMEFKRTVDTAVESLPEIHRKVIICKYKKHMTDVQTGFALTFTERHVRRLERSALVMLAERLEAVR